MQHEKNTAPQEPLKLTLEEAIQLLGPDEVLLVGYCGWEGMQYSVVEESSVKFLTHSYSKWEDALTDRLDRKVVARDEAALTYEGQPISAADAQLLLDAYAHTLARAREALGKTKPPLDDLLRRMKESDAE